MARFLLPSLVLSTLLFVAAGAQQPAESPASAPAPVYCASATCFSFRVAAQGKSADARASAAIDVINKYLGGKIGKVSTKPDGKNARLFLNNELVAVVTPADAAAEKQKTAADLATIWGSKLSKAFEASKAQR
jgi:hypothetical protein